MDRWSIIRMGVSVAPFVWASRILRSPKNRRRRKQIIRGILGVTFSLVPFFVAMILVDGMIQGISGRYIEIHTYHYQVRELSADQEERDQLRNRLQSLEGVRIATEIKEANGIIMEGNRRTGVLLRGLPDGYNEIDQGFSETLIIDQGAWDLSTEGSAVIASSLAEELGVTVGSTISILTPLIAPNGKTFLKKSSFTVTATFSTGYHSLGTNTVYIQDKKIDKLFPQLIPYIGIKIDSYGTNAGMNSISHIYNTVGVDGRVIEWMELENALYRNFLNSKQFIQIVMVLIFLIASINISTTILFVGLESTDDVALMRVHGASRKTIGYTFLLVGGLIGFVGALFGVIIGLILGSNIGIVIRGIQRFLIMIGAGGESFNFYLTDIPVIIDPSSVVFTFFTVLLLALLFSLVPARRISRQQITALLRKS